MSGLNSHFCHWLPVQFFLNCRRLHSLDGCKDNIQMLSPPLLAFLAFGSPSARRDLPCVGAF